MTGPVLVLCEHDRGVIAPDVDQAFTAARRIAGQLGVGTEAVLVGTDAAGLVPVIAPYGVDVVHEVSNPDLVDFGAAAWSAAMTAVIEDRHPSAVLALASDRGGEVMAHTAARLDLPLAANCVAFAPGDPWSVTRVQWGGSLLEDCTLAGPTPLITVARHAIEPVADPGSSAPSVRSWQVELTALEASTQVQDRVVLDEGVSLATAPVVVSGGRGVGSADGFGPLEDLADLLGGRVGCSRAVTNNGWRSHTDQVGQTGTRIAPELYMACGISGAIQHWVGAMASKRILAINTDPGATMVAKADYAVIGDLHHVVPAIAEEIRRRRRT